jgi:hypothetical protein
LERFAPEGNETGFYRETAKIKESSWLEVHVRTEKVIEIEALLSWLLSKQEALCDGPAS